MFKKINFPFYQNQWFGIKFSELNVKLSLIKLPTKIFYDSFYNLFKTTYSSLDSLPLNYLNEKAQISNYLMKYYSDKKILSYGSGLGVIEKLLLENKVKINAYDSSKETKNIIKGLNYLDDFPSSEKYEVIYLSYVLYSMKTRDILELLGEIKKQIEKSGELIIIFNERKSITIRSILRIVFIFLFSRLNYQFWGFERNRYFYIELLKKNNFEIIKFNKLHNHSILCFTLNKT